MTDLESAEAHLAKAAECGDWAELKARETKAIMTELASLRAFVGSAKDFFSHVIREDNERHGFLDDATLSDENGKVRTMREQAKRMVTK